MQAQKEGNGARLGAQVQEASQEVQGARALAPQHSLQRHGQELTGANAGQGGEGDGGAVGEEAGARGGVRGHHAPCSPCIHGRR